jgi:hypothetical protein
VFRVPGGAMTVASGAGLISSTLWRRRNLLLSSCSPSSLFY